MGNYVLRNYRITFPSDGTASVSDEGTRAHCGHNGQQKEFGDSHFREDMKDYIKEKKVH